MIRKMLAVRLAGAFLLLGDAIAASAQPAHPSRSVSEVVYGHPRTMDEIRWGAHMDMAPKVSCNTHWSATAARDSFGRQCDMLQILCRYGSSRACHRVAPYKPDFHNIIAEARSQSFETMGGYLAERQAARSPLLPGGAPPSRRIDMSRLRNVKIERKVLGGASDRQP